MTSDNFCYWLQGFFEITGEVPEFTPEQIQMIRDHLKYVFDEKERQSKASYTSLLSMPSATFC